MWLRSLPGSAEMNIANRLRSHKTVNKYQNHNEFVKIDCLLCLKGSFDAQQLIAMRFCVLCVKLILLVF